MKAVPALTARAFRPLVSGLRALGQDPGVLLAHVGVDIATLDDPDARVPMSAGVGLLARAAVALGDECVGLHLAERADLRTVDIHYYAMTASTSLRDAYERLSRYQGLIHETTRIEMIETDVGLTLRHVLPGGVAAPRQTAEFLLAAWVRTGRMASATDPIVIGVRPPRLALAGLGLAAIADAIAGTRLVVHAPLVVAGSLMGVAGLFLMLWAWRLFVSAKVAIRPTAETVRLVNHGPYRVTRNPMYLGLVLMLLGVAVWRGSAPYYFAALVFFAIIDRVFCRFEEAKLTARFGDEYLTYARRVRRWV
jgi:protein-S-isoprenylcysteine O-methyltransferase Ste14